MTTPSTPPQKPLILASGSSYRAELLKRLTSLFTVKIANIDEKPKTNETPLNLASRLAKEKARKVAGRQETGLVLGCDQVAYLEGSSNTTILGKPGNHQRALEQLRLCSAKTVHFISACCLIDASNNQAIEYFDRSAIVFRALRDSRIERYLNAEKPYDCAGSIKTEGLGIALIEKFICDDPSSIIGLPLIKTTNALNSMGWDVI